MSENARAPRRIGALERRMAALRVVLCAAVVEDDLRQIMQGIVRRAKQGDVAAAKVVLGYVMHRRGSSRPRGPAGRG
jgi:hypothetical protein